jgi:2-polyprenyl-3-methyl-5-hydroxy-6-metoxy-1,4-benzoquinol methylase
MTAEEYTLLDQQLMRRATRYFAWQARLVKEHLGRRVIETGCGSGNFTRYLTDCDEVIAIDEVEACAEQARAKFAEYPNLHFECLDILDPAFRKLKALGADSIVCLNVLEHVKDDRLALEQMREVLAPGGRAIFLLPAFQSLYGPIDRNLVHFRRYSKRSWKTLAENAGFHIQRSRYFNSLGFLGWWVNSKVLRKEKQSEAQIAVFDRFCVPVLSRLERWVEPPFGQSIFSVLEKR